MVLWYLPLKCHGFTNPGKQARPQRGVPRPQVAVLEGFFGQDGEQAAFF